MSYIGLLIISFVAKFFITCTIPNVGATMFRKKSGFTMIEVMVSLAIFVGCLASVLGGYNLLSRPYRGMYDGARELIADIENCAVNFDKIMTGDNGSLNKGVINPKKQRIKSLLVNELVGKKVIQAEFDIFITTNKGHNYNPITNGSKTAKGAFAHIWSGGKDILKWGKYKYITLCQFNIENHPILDAAKKRYGASKVNMKNVYFYSFRDII